MDLKSIGKLTTRIYDSTLSNQTRDAFERIAEEIEQEIVERYIELPVDADGVPIRVGDTVEYLNGKRDVVRFITVNDNEPTFNEMGWIASKCRHVKPRTIEDVLRDCCNEWNEHCGDDWESGVYAKYAEEIRGMMA